MTSKNNEYMTNINFKVTANISKIIDSDKYSFFFFMSKSVLKNTSNIKNK